MNEIDEKNEPSERCDACWDRPGTFICESCKRPICEQCRSGTYNECHACYKERTYCCEDCSGPR